MKLDLYISSVLFLTFFLKLKQSHTSTNILLPKRVASPLVHRWPAPAPRIINRILNTVAAAFTEPPPQPPSIHRPCAPSPCGVNTQCRERLDQAVCECLPDHRGDPYVGCYPECLANTDCPNSRACIRRKCQDPCVGTCGIGAVCSVSNHVPVCSCPYPTVGNAFTICRPGDGNDAYNYYLLLNFEKINRNNFFYIFSLYFFLICSVVKANFAKSNILILFLLQCILLFYYYKLDTIIFDLYTKEIMH